MDIHNRDKFYMHCLPHLNFAVFRVDAVVCVCFGWDLDYILHQYNCVFKKQEMA